MKIKIEKSLNAEEVLTRIRSFEKKYKNNFKKFEIKNRERKNNQIQEDLEQWQKLIHAYSAYLEEGEIFFKTFDELDIPINELRAILSPNRMMLLEILQKQNFDSISHLSRTSGRDIKNIHQDLMLFKRHGIVEFESAKKNKVPKLKVGKFLVEV